MAGQNARQSSSGGAGCVAPSAAIHSAGLSSTAAWEAVGGGSGARHVTGCHGLAPPRFLLAGKRKDKVCYIQLFEIRK